MFTVGLTGGIASGKSAVAELLRHHGAALIDTDSVAREVVKPGSPGLAALVDAFGTAILQNDGTLDRGALRQLAFADPEARARLDALLHPLIRERTVELMAAAAGTAPYLVVAVPLLVETGFAELVDRVLVVDCPPELQRLRLLARDDVDTATTERMIAAQVSRAERLRHADDVLPNAGTLDELADGVAKLHAQYLNAAQPSVG